MICNGNIWVKVSGAIKKGPRFVRWIEQKSTNHKATCAKQRDADFAKFYSQTAIQIQHHSTTYHIPLQKPAPAGTHARSSFGSFAPPAPPAHRWATAKIWARHQIHKCAWVDVHDAQDQLLWYNPGNPWKLQKNDIRIFVQNLIPTNFHKTRCFCCRVGFENVFCESFSKRLKLLFPAIYSCYSGTRDSKN